jgi:IS4 transposase
VSGAFFVTRANKNLLFAQQESPPVDKTTAAGCDQVGCLTLPKARDNFPLPVQRIRFFGAQKKCFPVHLTNHRKLPPLTIAKIYKKRWDIELFFKWTQGNLRIKHEVGINLIEVKTEIGMAVATFLLVPIRNKKLKLPGILHKTLRITGA